MLNYRRQFILSSSHLNFCPYWKKKTISTEFYLEVHPDLDFVQVNNNGICLTLLGYLIDPDHPERQNKDILNNLNQNIPDNDTIFRHMARFGGRWILIVNSISGTILFSDPGGLRSVYYTDAKFQPFYCASQPGLIADILGYKNNREESGEGSIFSSEDVNDREYWLPSGTSPYKEIKHLIPNHYLHIQKREMKRFWPDETLQKIDLDEGIRRANSLLKKLIVGAASRYDLAMTITAGIDSRSLLAASKSLKDQIYYYTLMYYDLNENSPDIKIPKQLSNLLNFEHHTLDCSTPMASDFRKIYLQNVHNAHEDWGDIAYGLSKQFPQDRICVKGNCCEIARCYFYNYDYPKSLNGHVLAKLADMEKNSVAINNFESWLRRTESVARASKIDILDLFYWEHRIGSWQAMSQLEWDIVQETFTPFNCRNLISILLSVDSKYRRPPKYKLFRDMISMLWPEVLCLPINPEPHIFRFKPQIKSLLRFTGSYGIVKKFFS